MITYGNLIKMISLDTKLSRREALKLGGITAANLIVPASEDRIRVVTPLIKQRQQLLDQLVAEEQSPDVGRVIYDHDGSLKKEEDYDFIRRTLSDKKYLEYLFNYPNNRLFYHLKQRGHTARSIQETLRDVPGFAMPFLIRLFYNALHRHTIAEEAYASTVLFPSDFGKGEKSDIYVFGGTFDTFYLSTPNGLVEVSTKKIIRAILHHEYVHARDNRYGINLGNGLTIDSTNKFNLDPRVKSFVLELNAFLNGLEEPKKSSRDDTEVIFELGNLSGYVSEFFPRIRDGKFTPYEMGLVQAQIDRIYSSYPKLIKIVKLIK